MFAALSKMDRKKHVAYLIFFSKYPLNLRSDKKKIQTVIAFSISILAAESKPTGIILNAVSKTINAAGNLLFRSNCMLYMCVDQKAASINNNLKINNFLQAFSLLVIVANAYEIDCYKLFYLYPSYIFSMTNTLVFHELLKILWQPGNQ